jgi:hypothetical protein
MFQFYANFRQAPIGHRLVLLAVALRAAGFVGLVAAGIFSVAQGGYLEAAVSLISIPVWAAVTTEVADWVMGRHP